MILSLRFLLLKKKKSLDFNVKLMLSFVTTVNIFKTGSPVSKARKIIVFEQRAGIVAALNSPPPTRKVFFGSSMLVNWVCLQC